MKNQREALLFSACMLLLTPSYSQQTIDFVEGIESGKIAVEFLSNGTSSEDCVTTTIRNLTNEDLNLRVGHGLHLATVDKSQQDIIVTQSEEILVDAGSSVTENLYGFCGQAFNDVPQEGSSFTVNGYADGQLGKLTAFTDARSLDPDLIQEAVWTITEGLPIAGIHSENEGDTQELREICAGITGAEMPSYNIDYGDVLNTQFTNEVVELNGTFEYAIERDARATLVMYGPNGEEITKYYEGQLLHPARYTQNFSFSGNGMEKGEYRFVLYINNESHREMTFEI